MSEPCLPIHPYAELFPPMSLAEFERLCDDIEQHGLQEDIVVHEAKILDGRSRYLACLARGVTPRVRSYAGECGSPLAFVIARNLHRRHLTEGQRALVAARLKPLFEDEARQRQMAALKHGTDSPVGQNSVRREKHEENRKSARRAAELMKVSHFSVQAADKVQKHGVEPLVAAVGGGKVSVSAAARIAALPAEQQHAVVARIESGLKPSQALAGVHSVADSAAAWVDDEGQALPESVLPAFRERERFTQLCRRIEGVVRAVEQLGKTPASVYLDVWQVSGPLQAASRTLAAARPARLCPHSSPAQTACESCRGHGWLPAGYPPLR
jgi:ParB-like chromosome segregation protein Spo0J